MFAFFEFGCGLSINYLEIVIPQGRCCVAYSLFLFFSFFPRSGSGYDTSWFMLWSMCGGAYLVCCWRVLGSVSVFFLCGSTLLVYLLAGTLFWFGSLVETTILSLPRHTSVPVIQVPN